MDRKEVIKITLELMKEKKLEKTTIGEIVKRLDLSPGSLYYHFKNKSEIYKEMADYSLEEITRNLNEVRTAESNKNKLFILTRALIKFLEEREEILFFLISMKGSCYLEEEIKSQDFLINFKNILLTEQQDINHKKRMLLKLNMFLGSIYEVLYDSKLVNGRNLAEFEIRDIHASFWGNEIFDTKYNN